MAVPSRVSGPADRARPVSRMERSGVVSTASPEREGSGGAAPSSGDAALAAGLVGGRALVGSALGGTVGRLGGQRDHDLLGQQGGCGLFGAHVRKRREACQRELSSGAVCGVGHVEGVVVGLLAGHVP